MQDYYQILGVSRDVDDKELKKAYKQLALKYHPDRNSDPGAAETFSKIAEAYDVLSTPDKRTQYDRFGSYNDSGFNQQQQYYYNASDFSNMNSSYFYEVKEISWPVKLLILLAIIAFVIFIIPLIILGLVIYLVIRLIMSLIR